MVFGRYLLVATELKGFTQNYYTFPQTLFAKSVTGRSTFHRLQKLSLQWVFISNDVVQDIIRHLYFNNFLDRNLFRFPNLTSLSQIVFCILQMKMNLAVLVSMHQTLNTLVLVLILYQNCLVKSI